MIEFLFGIVIGMELLYFLQQLDEHFRLIVLLRMILLQALVVGGIGFGLGVGGAALFGYLMKGTELSFRLIPEILLLSGAAILIIITFSALISIRKVMKLEPAIVFKA